MSSTRRLLGLLASGAFLVVLLATILSSLPAQAVRRDALPDMGIGSFLIHSDAEVTRNSEAFRGSVVVLQSWQTQEVARLRRLNPTVTVLMYKNMSATYRNSCQSSCSVDDDAHQPGGVGYHWAAANRPQWFLRDGSGVALEWADWRGLFPMDSSRRDYQDTWTRNVLSDLGSADWDGVLLDDALTWLSHPTVGDAVSTQIPDDRTQYAATASFLERVGPALKDAGFLVIPNVTLSWDNWKPTLEELTPWVSGWENEHFVMWGRDGTATRFRDTDDWTWKMEMSAWLADRDLPFLAVTYSTARDTAAMRFHRATWLLTWNGRTGGSVYVADGTGVPQNPPASAEFVGQPTHQRTRLASGVWTREYAEGLVLVNPTASSQLVAVPPGYGTSTGRAVTSLRMPPSTGKVLYRR